MPALDLVFQRFAIFTCTIFSCIYSISYILYTGFTILIPDYTSSTSISTCHFEQVVPVPGLFLDFTTMSLLVAVPNHFVRVVSGLFGHVYSHLSWLSCPINFPLPCIVC